MYSIDCMKKIKTIIPLIITFCMNAVVYWGVPLLRTGIKTHNLSGPADEVIPFMPQFIIIYFGCYLFWVVNYFMASMREEKVKYRFFTADFYARLVYVCCALFFIRPRIRGRFWQGRISGRRQYGFCIQLISQSICFRPFTAWQAGSAVLRSGRTGRFPTGIKLFLS